MEPTGVWDRGRAGGRGRLALDLGCGDTKQYAGNVGVDLRPTARGPDVLADLTPTKDDGAGPVAPERLARCFD